MAGGPTVRIVGPAPLPPVYTLIGAGEVVPEDNTQGERWGAGIAVDRYTCALPNTWEHCSPQGSLTAPDKGTPDPVGTLDPPIFESFTIVLEDECSTVGMSQWYDEFVRRLTVAFEASQHFALEQEAWAPASTGNFGLRDFAEDLTPGGALDPLRVLALLEERIADTGRLGMIHCTPSLLLAWVNLRVVETNRTSGKAYSAMGTPIVPSGGYDGTGSTVLGSPALNPNEEWAVATGRVQIRLGPVYVNPTNIKEAINRRTNLIKVYAERLANVSWDRCFQAGALVDLCQVCTTPVGS